MGGVKTIFLPPLLGKGFREGTELTDSVSNCVVVIALLTLTPCLSRVLNLECVRRPLRPLAGRNIVDLGAYFAKGANSVSNRIYARIRGNSAFKSSNRPVSFNSVLWSVFVILMELAELEFGYGMPSLLRDAGIGNSGSI